MKPSDGGAGPDGSATHGITDDVSRETSAIHGAELQRVAEAVQRPLSQEAIGQLLRYADWLRTEAQDAGGIGPDEADRVIDRHVADSMAYAFGLTADPPFGTDTHGSPASVVDPARIVDVGSGVGLPGIPLAVLFPDTEVTLLDRAGGRAELARRAIRIMKLENVEVVNVGVEHGGDNWPVVVFRASLPLIHAARAFGAMASDHGIGLFGVTRRRERPDIADAPAGVAFDLAAVGASVLDSPLWLLRMRRT